MKKKPTQTKFIPVCDNLFEGNEKKYLNECIDTGWVSSEGRFVKEFEERFAEWSGNKYAVAVCNGTAALQTAIFAMDIKGKIAIPSGTIVSCVVAAFRNNLQIEFYDKQIMRNNLLRCHLFGKLNEGIGMNVIDDCSQYWKPFRTTGIAGYSLYANKLITSGEGGILTTNDVDMYEKAKAYRNLCHTDKRFVHTHVAANFRMSNLQAALALAQLEQIHVFTGIKQTNRELYKKYLPKDVTILFDVDVPWMYLIKTKLTAEYVMHRLKKQGIGCRGFFFPLHRQPFILNQPPYNPKMIFPYTEDLWQHAFYLPSGLTLTEKEIIRVCRCLKSTLNITT